MFVAAYITPASVVAIVGFVFRMRDKGEIRLNYVKTTIKQSEKTWAYRLNYYVSVGIVKYYYKLSNMKLF